MSIYDEDREDSDLVKRLRKEIEDRDKALKQRDQELGDLRRKDSQRTVADTFSARGVNPRYARFALADLDEVTDESVAGWIEANADLIGVQAPPPVESAVDSQAASYQRMAAVEQYAQPGIPGDARARIESAQTEAEVWEALGVHGGR